MPLEGLLESESSAIGLLKKRLSKFETEKGRLLGLSYQPRPNDVAISTTPKAGTTWMQQICHQLRSGGDMSFDEISAVVPWLELAFDQGQDLSDEQAFTMGGRPRLFKTHAWADHCPSFRRTIVVLRDPCDVVTSFFTFFENWFFPVGDVSLDDFANAFWLARDVPSNRMQNASYFIHLTSWYQQWQADDPNRQVLFIFYEDLRNDLKSQVQLIARFLSHDECDLDQPKLVRVAVKQSTFDFMKQHESQFDERLSKLARNEACGLAKDAGVHKSKLHTGTSRKDLLSCELRDKIEAKWQEVVEPVTGCNSYEELRGQIRKLISTG